MNDLPRSFVARLMQSVVSSTGAAIGSNYLALIDKAFLAEPPVYASQWFGDLFRRRGRDPSWVVSLLAADSYMEGYSAGRLWQYAEKLDDPGLAQAMRRHARDEAKHSRLFSSTIFRAFPSLVDQELRTKLESNAPSFSSIAERSCELDSPSPDEVLSSMLLVNLFEIKALVLGMLTKPMVIAHAPNERWDVLRKIFDVIILDEARHIRYSADYLEGACMRGGRSAVEDALRDFQATLNTVTLAELEKDAYDERGTLAA